MNKKTISLILMMVLICQAACQAGSCAQPECLRPIAFYEVRKSRDAVKSTSGGEGRPKAADERGEFLVTPGQDEGRTAAFEEKSAPTTDGSNAVMNALENSLVERGLFERPLVRYFRAFQRRVNPAGREFTVVYGAAGSDISGLLLVTNFTKTYFLNSYAIDIKKLQDLISRWDLDPAAMREYAESKRTEGFVKTTLIDKLGIERCLILELQAMGVRQADIKVDFADKQHNL